MAPVFSLFPYILALNTLELLRTKLSPSWKISRISLNFRCSMVWVLRSTTIILESSLLGRGLEAMRLEGRSNLNSDNFKALGSFWVRKRKDNVNLRR